MTHPPGAGYTGAAPALESAVPAAVRAEGVRVGGIGPVSLDLRCGDVAVVVSRPPCDGHTLLAALSGLRAPDEGRVTIAGRELTALDAEAAARARYEHVGYVLRDIGLHPERTVAQNIAAPLGLAGRTENRDDAEWLARLAQSFGIADALDALPERLSPGRQQCVAIARALATRPSLVYAEEPTGRLDERGGRVVLALLRTIAHEYGIAIAISTERPDIAAQSDRVLVVRDGRIVADRRGADAASIQALLDDAPASTSTLARLHPVE